MKFKKRQSNPFEEQISLQFVSQIYYNIIFNILQQFFIAKYRQNIIVGVCMTALTCKLHAQKVKLQTEIERVWIRQIKKNKDWSLYINFFSKKC